MCRCSVAFLVRVCAFNIQSSPPIIIMSWWQQSWYWQGGDWYGRWSDSNWWETSQAGLTADEAHRSEAGLTADEAHRREQAPQQAPQAEEPQADRREPPQDDRQATQPAQQETQKEEQQEKKEADRPTESPQPQRAQTFPR